MGVHGNQATPRAPRLVRTVLAVMIAASGCGERGQVADDTTGSQAFDSAGVQVQVHAGPPEELPVGFRVDPEPVMLLTGEEPEVGGFFRTRNAVRLRGGGIAVAMMQEVAVYGAGGDLVATVESGDGPAEVRSVGAVMPHPSGGFGVWDMERRRILVFDSDGEFIAGAPLDGGQERLDWSGTGWLRGGLRGFFPDGGFVMLQELPAREVATHRVVRGTSRVLAYAGQGGTWEVQAVLSGARRYRIPGMQMALSPIPFDADPWAWVQGEETYVADVARSEVRVIDRAGRLIRVIRRINGGRTVTSEMRQRYIAEQMEVPNSEAGRARMRERLDEIPAWPDEHAVFDRVMVSPDGTVFAREPGDCHDAHCWTAYTPDGEAWLVAGMLDEAYVVHQVDSDAVVATTAMGVQVVVIHELRDVR